MNKKLIKSIVSIACGLGVATSIPLATSSYTYTKKESTKLVKGIESESSTEININATKLWDIVCSQIEDQSIVVNKSFSLGVTDAKLVFCGMIEIPLSSSDIASYELVNNDGQSAENTLPQGLSFNTSNGSISGTVTSLNFYAPTTYKIKITSSERVGSVVGYSNAFTLSMKDNPLPESVYDINTSNVLVGFKEGVDLSQYEDVCNTMQIPANVKVIVDGTFSGASSSLIPSYIKNLTFEEGSNLTAIGDGAFKKCYSLTSIDFSNCTELTEIGDYAFYNCLDLTSVTFPGSLNVIGTIAFIGCSSLTSILWKDLNIAPTIFDHAFSGAAPHGGIVKSTGTFNSLELLQLLVSNGGLPSTGWTWED